MSVPLNPLIFTLHPSNDNLGLGSIAKSTTERSYLRVDLSSSEIYPMKQTLFGIPQDTCMPNGSATATSAVLHFCGHTLSQRVLTLEKELGIEYWRGL